MKFLIIYFSGTGNTKLIAEEIAKRIELRNHSVELVSVEDTNAMRHVSFKGKVIGFGFPVYKFSYPDIFTSFFPLFKSLAAGTPCFLFSTYARFPSISFIHFSKMLGRKFIITAEKSFKAPCCGIASRKDESDYEYLSGVFFEDTIGIKIDAFTQTVLASLIRLKRIKHIPLPFTSVLTSLVADIEKTKYPKLQIAKETCTLCGLCASKCPEGNLILSGPEIIIRNERSCLHCLRCINHCPSNAVKFGKLTEGNNRYTLKKRDLLFKIASSEYENPYWKEFDSIKKRWRMATIRYYIAHRNNPEE